MASIHWRNLHFNGLNNTALVKVLMFHTPAGFYRGQYKNGQRGGYGTRSSAGYEKSKESFIDSGDKTKQFKIHQRPTIANIMANNAMPLWSSWSLDRRSDAGALMGDVGKRGSNWKQIYQGQWINDKRCGYGVLKVSDCFTYYGQWKENTRTGYGVLVHEGHKTGKKGTKREEVKEEGRWDNGKLVEPVKYARVMKTELKLKVDEAHHEAIKAASHAREQALLAEAKANAAAAKSKVADLRAIEAQQDAESAANIVEQTVKISKETLENVCVIKGSVRITVNGQHYGEHNIIIALIHHQKIVLCKASFTILNITLKPFLYNLKFRSHVM